MKTKAVERRQTVPIAEVAGTALSSPSAFERLCRSEDARSLRWEIERRSRQEARLVVRMDERLKEPAEVGTPTKGKRNAELRRKTFDNYLKAAVKEAQSGLARLMILAADTPEDDKEEHLAPRAAAALVALLILNADDVASVLDDKTAPEYPAFSRILSQSLRWPCALSPYPRDRATIGAKLRKGGFGKNAPLYSASTGKKNAPGPMWAKRFFLIVESMKAAKASEGIASFAGWVDTPPKLRQEVCALPPLRNEPVVINAWHKTLIAWLDQHHPKYMHHPDWKAVKGGSARIRKRLKDGLRQVAPGE